MTPLYKINLRGSNPPKNSGQVWAKLENQNPTGTHKDRSMGSWISHYLERGIREFAISSSGNSAISAAEFCAGKNVKLHVFVSPNIEKYKISRLRSEKNIILNISKTPRRDAIRLAKGKNIVNLRASKDDNALIGYQDIAFELTQQLPSIDNIFIPTSSGATLEGIYGGFKGGKTQKMPAFFVIQTAKVHPIANYFDQDFTKEKASHATAIVDRVAHRRDRVIEIVKETGGGGFVISNKELEEAKKILDGNGGWHSHAPSGAWHSALSFAGFLKWQKQNPKTQAKKISVCIFTD